MKKWELPQYPSCYVFERNGKAHTYINGIRKSTKYKFVPENKIICLDIMISRINENHSVFKPVNTWFQLLEYYYKSVNLSENLANRMKRTTLRLLPEDFYLDNIPFCREQIIKNLNKSEFENYKQKKWNLVTAKRELERLKQVFTFACEEGLMPFNPINKRLIPAGKEEKIRRAFTDNELFQILEHFKEDFYFYRLLMILRITGMRIEEAIKLTKSSIKADRLIIMGKGSIERKFPLEHFQDLKKILLELSEKTENKLFPYPYYTKQGTYLRDFLRVNNLYFKFSGFHAIRRYRVNELLKSGVDFKTISEMTGHTIPILMKYYAELFSIEELNKNLKRAIKKAPKGF